MQIKVGGVLALTLLACTSTAPAQTPQQQRTQNAVIRAFPTFQVVGSTLGTTHMDFNLMSLTSETIRANDPAVQRQLESLFRTAFQQDPTLESLTVFLNRRNAADPLHPMGTRFFSATAYHQQFLTSKKIHLNTTQYGAHPKAVNVGGPRDVAGVLLKSLGGLGFQVYPVGGFVLSAYGTTPSQLFRKRWESMTKKQLPEFRGLGWRTQNGGVEQTYCGPGGASFRVGARPNPNNAKVTEVQVGRGDACSAPTGTFTGEAYALARNQVAVVFPNFTLGSSSANMEALEMDLHPNDGTGQRPTDAAYREYFKVAFRLTPPQQIVVDEYATILGQANALPARRITAEKSTFLKTGRFTVTLRPQFNLPPERMQGQARRNIAQALFKTLNGLGYNRFPCKHALFCMSAKGADAAVRKTVQQALEKAFPEFEMTGWLMANAPIYTLRACASNGANFALNLGTNGPNSVGVEVVPARVCPGWEY